ncbi:MAG: hypothetical protein JSS20_07515, partial [Proteobacteria bacterium]|nr:hypothetical protein [Pseudomonadota bacterium]
MKYVKWLVLGLVVATVGYVGGSGTQNFSALMAKVQSALPHTGVASPAASASAPASAPAAKPKGPAVPAVVATVQQKEMPIDFRSVGSVQAESSVQIKVR